MDSVMVRSAVDVWPSPTQQSASLNILCSTIDNPHEHQFWHYSTTQYCQWIFHVIFSSFDVLNEKQVDRSPVKASPYLLKPTPGHGIIFSLIDVSWEILQGWLIGLERMTWQSTCQSFINIVLCIKKRVMHIYQQLSNCFLGVRD